MAHEDTISVPRTARRRRVWSETLPYDALASKEVGDLLLRYDLEVLVAVTPSLRAEAPRVLRALADRGARAAVWPMIDDAEGRWASAPTLTKYVAFVDALTADLARAHVAVTEVAIDLEPPFSVAKAASHGTWLDPIRGALAGREDFWSAATNLRSYVDRLGKGTRVTCAAVPLVLLDEPNFSGAHGDGHRDSSPAGPTGLAHPPNPARPGRPGNSGSLGSATRPGSPGNREPSAAAERPFFQALLGTPVDAVPFGSVSIMAYTSILEGWSRGLLDRRASLGVLGECARLSVARYAARASLSIGTVGVGAFTDEPIYRGPSELAEDVAVARAFGVDDLSLFDLGGIVRRGPPEAWLEAFVNDTERPHDLPRRVRIGSACLRALARFGGAP